MALQKQTVTLNLSTGGDQKTDPKTLSPGTPTKVENAQFLKANRVDKRAGYDDIGLGDHNDYYQEFSFHAVDDILQSKRVFVIDPGNDPGDVALDFVQPYPFPSFGPFLAEVQAYLNIPGGILKIRDINNVEWVVTRLNPMTITGQVSAAAFATVIIGLRTSGVDDVTITKDGVASSPTAMLAEFGDYEYSDSVAYAANNPEGPVRRVGPQIFTKSNA